MEKLLSIFLSWHPVLFGIINALLMIWMVLITREYVMINARILRATEGALRSGRKQAQLSLLQFSDQLQLRVGPIVGEVSRIRAPLRELKMALKGRSEEAVGAFQLLTSEDLSNFEFAVRSSAGVSHLAFKNMRKAQGELARLVLELREAALRSLDPLEWERLLNDANFAILPLLESAETSLSDALDQLLLVLETPKQTWLDE